ncbi:MAG: Glucoamylase [uncultured Chthoniobacterales bacterium]|uniref:Trehalase n=1 Tax=uncultured Chthoniobacterales bacterium TaxID=1836801 RepID=A0A6J4J309_9BACT|nr:MAG: Glucoamylase [uncultured Chthoniobacterales bacterium]
MTKIEDYGFLSDTQTAALVSRDGCIDWLCFPRFDSPACFASLLGTPENGHWSFKPVGEITATRRRYRGDTLILETEVETAEGTVRLIDFMPPRGKAPDIIRIVEGVRGTVTLRMELIIRFDYGSAVPWVRKRNGALEAIAGPDALVLRTPVATHGENLTTVAEFTVAVGERFPFVLTWFPSHEEQPPPVNAEHALEQTQAYWERWAGRFDYAGPWQSAVMRSLLTLKGLTYAPTGGIVAAATTSLPEEIGGVRNWDYRYCWLRDATFTLMALMNAGYLTEATAWRQWLLRAVAGSPAQMQIMYGVRGERRLSEFELPWLSGYEHSTPVRVGNAASEQFQLDVYGEVLDSMYRAAQAGIQASEADWRLQVALLGFLETKWESPDFGIWEIRGEPQHFTHSKMMAWVAFDRGVKLVEEHGCSADTHLEKWRELRDRIHRQVCELGYHEKKRAFTQFYGSDELDASILMMPLVGFLPAEDERVRNTVEAVERELMRDGFVLRYRTGEKNVDGLPGHEGVFLLCSFWLADCLHLIGRTEDARALFERLLALQNDLGLLAEEYDPVAKRQLGNLPQAFSHVALVNTARLLSRPANPPE